MGNIIVIDDRPIQALSLVREWADYYNYVCSANNRSPKFHIISIYKSGEEPEDIEDITTQVNKGLDDINSETKGEKFHKIELKEDSEIERMKEVEREINNVMDKFGEMNHFLLALDLHLFEGDDQRLNDSKQITSMFIYKMMNTKGKKVLLYTSFLDENNLAEKWKNVFKKHEDELKDFVFSRESALNYDVLVESAKELLDGVIE